MVSYKGLLQKCALAFLLVAGGVFAQENYSTWSSSGTIILNTSATGANVTTTQAGFPVLVRLTTANAANLITAENTGAKGADIRFARNGIHLPYEMIKWDSAGQKAFFWVRLDTVLGNSASQTINIYWGKTGAVDSSSGAAVFASSNGFIAAYHLNKALPDSSNGMHLYKDATGTYSNALGGTTVTDTDGIIDRARAFHQIGTQGQNNNAGDSIVIPGQMNKPQTLTFSAWVRVDSIDQYNQSANGHRANLLSIANIASLNDGGADGTGIDSFYMGFKAAGNWNNYGYYPSSGNQQTLLKQGWKYVAGKVNPSAGYAAIYLNGDSVASFASTDTLAWTATGNTKLGKQGTNDYGEKFGGSMCEVRFENVARTADWQRLCYQNQRADDKLLTVITTPLTVPLLSTPANGSVNQAPNLSLGWVAISNASSYAVQVSTGSAFATTVLNAPGLTVTSQALSGLAYNTTYFWHTNAVVSASTTGWSSTWSFTVGTLPTVPTLSTPTNGTKITGGSLTLAWSSASNVTFSLQVSTSSAFASTVLNQAGISANSKSVSGLAYPATYYWKVMASSNVGNSAWSTVGNFSTLTPSAVLPGKALASSSVELKLTSQAIAYTLPKTSAAVISFYDMLGRNVLNISNMQQAGRYSISLKKLNLAAGRYTVQLKAAGIQKRGTIFLTR